MNVNDQKSGGRIRGHGRGGGVAGRRGRRRGRTAVQSLWFADDAKDRVPLQIGNDEVEDVPDAAYVLNANDLDAPDEIYVQTDDAIDAPDVMSMQNDDEVDVPDATADETDEEFDEVDDDGEPVIYREGLRRDFKHQIPVTQVSFPCRLKPDLLSQQFQAKACLSRRQLNLFVLFVNDPWVRESGVSYENGKQMRDDGRRRFPMLQPVYVKTSVTKVVAKKGTINRQSGEKRTVTKIVKLKQFRVPDLVERSLANPLKGQHLKLGVKSTAAQVHNTIHNGPTEYRESEHALYAQRHRDTDTSYMITAHGSFQVTHLILYDQYANIHAHVVPYTS
jgi:hypothetical protein